MHRIPLLVIAGLSAGLSAGLAAAQAGEVYQWKDANGVTHYSQTPPPQGQFQQRQITSHGPASPQAAAPAKPAEDPQCAAARANLEVLQSGQPVHEAGEDGKPGRQLGEDERQSQIELANAAIRAYCRQGS